jgi:cell fate regulator YaaT (PSP1 superfamily)
MAKKSGQRGRYICKVGYLDVYAKDSFKPKKDSKYKFIKADVKSTVYNVLHAKKMVKGNFKTKDEAVAFAIESMGDKASIYGLK